MKEIIGAVIVSFLICLVGGALLIPALRRLKFGQTVRDDGPQTHLAKNGTPTMGGIFILLALVLAAVMFSKDLLGLKFTLAAVLSTLAFGLIGFLDDYIKVVRKRSLGLKAYQKIIGQAGAAIVLALFCYLNEDIGSKIWVPFLNVEWDLGIWYVPFAVFVIIGTVNSVNLTDGLDGLLSGVTTIVSAALVIIAYYMARQLGEAGAAQWAMNVQNVAVFCGAMAGACLGFLRFNAYPARVFMGDTGSLGLGGAVAAVALLLRIPLLVVVMGAAYVASSVSVILQVGSFKLRGKRIFKMAPLHHHFELKGHPESKIVAMYMIITALLCLVSLLTLG